MSIIVGNQGFDCVIKGFRVGRQSRRPKWPLDTVISWDEKQGEILMYYPGEGWHTWDPDYLGQDLMATDWEVYAV